jgi:hypothetical protein
MFMYCFTAIVVKIRVVSECKNIHVSAKGYTYFNKENLEGGGGSDEATNHYFSKNV